MAFTVSASTVIAMSAGVPATFNSAGYAALSWTTLGEVRDIAGYGPQWSIASHNPLALRGTQKKKTSRNGGSFTVTLALDTDDAGQIIAKAARDSATALYACRITASGGDVYYCQVAVTGFVVTPGSQSSDMTAVLTCEVSTSSTDVDWVEVLA